ncbi:phosphatidylinositol 3,4,5-trisphosphate 3-phosphatase TPTE2-like isoform X2 [Mesocricetus auratus]|uniref:Phosphatidylinositol 3,4,5-trisphosphate 3-phosphatase TPTE2-like isoform X2 n=1 Tax=Mesocricetus auratus TaxID=10036 RepID=A0ABM2WF22_MESAU|nr:phosphatidylinositol 3,4,5-trisphosphate 3-phosphatase TPTE2-like isoform X2 [Mesocricetus auratus]
MQWFKKNPLYLWFEHYGYKKSANTFIICSLSSEGIVNRNKIESSSASEVFKPNICPGKKEERTLANNESNIGSLYPAVTLSDYREPFSGTIYTCDSTSKSLYGAVSGSTSLYALNSSSDLMREITNSSGLKTACSTVSTSILIASSDVTSDFQEEDINECKLKQFSTMYDADECIDIRKTYCNTVKKIVVFLVSSVAFRIFGIMLMFVDIIFVAIDLHLIEKKLSIPLEYRSVSFAIALFFLVDVLLRVYVEGRQFFSDLLNTIYAVVIGVTLFIAFTYISYDKNFLRDTPRLAVLFPPLWLLILVRIFQLAHEKRYLEKLTRRLVSGNKRRYNKDGFDLDLTYVTERIIAMSFPSTGGQSFYRNPIKEVARFLDAKHPNHYQVYNLCSENSYDPKYFHYRVRRVMIDDHNVPTLEEMLLFSKEVNDWLTQHPENVVAIHCKGGKGRTGTMVCACLIASEVALNAKESLYFFGERRTDKSSSSKFQGIETPSQNRYVKYFEKLKVSYQWILPSRKILVIKRFIVYSIHGVGKGDGSDLEIQILMWQEIAFSCFSSKNCMIFHDVETDRLIINVFNCPALYDDVKVKFLSLNLPRYYDDCPFFFWFHTAFIRNNRLYLPRHELDNTHKPKAWKFYSPKFAVEVYFDEIKLLNK